MQLWSPLRMFFLSRLLYAVGGFDGERRLASVERYDPEADTWSEVAPLNRPRSGAGRFCCYVNVEVAHVVSFEYDLLTLLK